MVTLEEHVGDCVNDICNKTLNSFDVCLQIAFKPHTCLFLCPTPGQADKEAQAPTGDSNHPISCLSRSVLTQAHPLTTIKASSQSAFLALSSHFGPAWDCSAHPINLHYVSNRSFCTFTNIYVYNFVFFNV